MFFWRHPREASLQRHFWVALLHLRLRSCLDFNPKHFANTPRDRYERQKECRLIQVQLHKSVFINILCCICCEATKAWVSCYNIFTQWHSFRARAINSSPHTTLQRFVLVLAVVRLGCTISSSPSSSSELKSFSSISTSSDSSSSSLSKY